MSSKKKTKSSIGENVLIVDDDPHIREIIRFALKKSGFNTCEAPDGRQCLDIFSRQNPDLIILDILMPEMDGNEVCTKIRADSEVPIIFLSGAQAPSPEYVRRCAEVVGGTHFLRKPCDHLELLDVLGRNIAQRHAI